MTTKNLNGLPEWLERLLLIVLFILAVALLIVSATAAAGAQSTQIRRPYLRVAANRDALLLTLRSTPPRVGALYLEWRKASSSTDIFRYFLSSSGPITARTTYTRGYFDPRVRMQLSLTGGRNVLYDASVPIGPDHRNEEVTFAPGRWYRLLWIWAELDGVVYLAAFVDGREVAYRRIPGGRIGSWATHGVYLGARDLEPVEPTFPAQHHIDGELRHVWMGGWQ